MSRIASVRAAMTRLALLIVLTVATSVTSPAQTTTQSLSANISAVGHLFSFPNSVTLNKTGTIFNNYSGSLAVQYKARTSASGTGSITLKVTSDFSPAGGPSVATPPTAGDALTYTCSGATLGTACSGTQTGSTTSSTPVLLSIPASACTGGGTPCSTADPNTINVNFTLTNDPKYKTGNYAATLTFTISAS